MSELRPLVDYYPAVATAITNDKEFQTLVGRLVVAIRSGKSDEIEGRFNDTFAYTGSKWGMGREKWQHINTTGIAFRVAIKEFKEKNPIQ